MINTDFSLLVAKNEYFVKSSIRRSRHDSFLVINMSALSGIEALVILI